MAKVRAVQTLKDETGYHEVGAVFDANKADADRWIERGSAEPVKGGGGKGSGKGGPKSSETGAKGDEQTVAEYRQFHEEAMAAGNSEYAAEAEGQLRELGYTEAADELQNAREASGSGTE